LKGFLNELAAGKDSPLTIVSAGSDYSSENPGSRNAFARDQ
jgi:hypothetical protein